MATSSMESSGSLVVKFCSHIPGADRIRVTDVYKRQGIGLAVCDEIVQRHCGVFDIGNADGGGAIVTIRLPISGQEL